MHALGGGKSEPPPSIPATRRRDSSGSSNGESASADGCPRRGSDRCTPVARRSGAASGSPERSRCAMHSPREPAAPEPQTRLLTSLSAREAEGEGFEPSMRLTTDNGFRASCGLAQPAVPSQSPVRNRCGAGFFVRSSQWAAIGGDRDARVDAAIPFVDQWMVNGADAATSYGVVLFLSNWTT
jgi:hypothetical protein